MKKRARLDLGDAVPKSPPTEKPRSPVKSPVKALHQSDCNEFVQPSRHLFSPLETFEICKTAKTFKPNQMGGGLKNLGNTCFMNSVLQCLTYTEPLLFFLSNIGHSANCKNRSGFCALCAMETHIQKALKERVHAPTIFSNNLSNMSKRFRLGRQEDAHEFVRFVVEAFHKAFLAEHPGLKDHRVMETTFTSQIFSGYLRSQVHCQSCGHKSNTFDPFSDLSLELLKLESVESALDHYTQTETLDLSNKYKCDKCKKLVRATKRLAIFKAPPILTVQLKRFQFTTGFSGGKILRHIKFGPALDLAPFVCEGHPCPDFLYDLYGVVVHLGASTQSGHYYSYVKRGAKWFRCDDSMVSEVVPSAVFRENAYLLFYTRRNPEQPSLSFPPSAATDLSASMSNTSATPPSKRSPIKHSASNLIGPKLPTGDFFGLSNATTTTTATTTPSQSFIGPMPRPPTSAPSPLNLNLAPSTLPTQPQPVNQNQNEQQKTNETFGGSISDTPKIIEPKLSEISVENKKMDLGEKQIVSSEDSSNIIPANFDLSSIISPILNKSLGGQKDSNPQPANSTTTIHVVTNSTADEHQQQHQDDLPMIAKKKSQPAAPTPSSSTSTPSTKQTPISISNSNKENNKDTNVSAQTTSSSRNSTATATSSTSRQQPSSSDRDRERERERERDRDFRDSRSDSHHSSSSSHHYHNHHQSSRERERERERERYSGSYQTSRDRDRDRERDSRDKDRYRQPFSSSTSSSQPQQINKSAAATRSGGPLLQSNKENSRSILSSAYYSDSSDSEKTPSKRQKTVVSGSHREAENGGAAIPAPSLGPPPIHIDLIPVNQNQNSDQSPLPQSMFTEMDRNLSIGKHQDDPKAALMGTLKNLLAALGGGGQAEPTVNAQPPFTNAPPPMFTQPPPQEPAVSFPPPPLPPPSVSVNQDWVHQNPSSLIGAPILPPPQPQIIMMEPPEMDFPPSRSAVAQSLNFAPQQPESGGFGGGGLPPIGGQSQVQVQGVGVGGGGGVVFATSFDGISPLPQIGGPAGGSIPPPTEIYLTRRSSEFSGAAVPQPPRKLRKSSKRTKENKAKLREMINVLMDDRKMEWVKELVQDYQLSMLQSAQPPDAAFPPPVAASNPPHTTREDNDSAFLRSILAEGAAVSASALQSLMPLPQSTSENENSAPSELQPNMEVSPNMPWNQIVTQSTRGLLSEIHGQQMTDYMMSVLEELSKIPSHNLHENNVGS